MLNESPIKAEEVSVMTRDEFVRISRELEAYHGIFAKIWDMGKLMFDKDIPTACVMFNNDGNFFEFRFNPDFYNSLDDYNRKFVICHEALHVILNHGVRSIGMEEKELFNMAADVVINESLVSSFGFIRSNIKDADNFCWYNTVFKDPKLACGYTCEKDRSMEYYYSLLNDKMSAMAGKSKSKGMPSNGSNGDGGESGKGPKTVDDHSNMGKNKDGEQQDNQIIGGKLDEICDGLSDEEKKKLKDIIDGILDTSTKQEIKAGTLPGNITKIMSVEKVKKKKKWETVIKKWSEKYLHRNDKSKEQWARTNRRFVTLSKELFIPTEMEIDEKEKEKRKIKVVFFLDTSGSCAGLAERFWKAAKSLPEDRFEIHLCCFDTRVYETSLKSGKLYGFGGTSFSILEAYVKKMPKYPDAVFCITDGYGDYINPQFPKKWYWFLSTMYTSYIPKTCNIFDLKQFE